MFVESPNSIDPLFPAHRLSPSPLLLVIELGHQEEAKTLLTQIAAQPVFEKQRFQQLQSVYAQKFGTAWE